MLPELLGHYRMILTESDEYFCGGGFMHRHRVLITSPNPCARVPYGAVLHEYDSSLGTLNLTARHLLDRYGTVFSQALCYVLWDNVILSIVRKLLEVVQGECNEMSTSGDRVFCRAVS